ncbi:hypothetical protein GOA99_18630 [Sinorhizobium meliloti]|nr:hypothetical protein [Sinorhizobium meliloti]
MNEKAIGNVPFTKDEVLEELKGILYCQASQIALVGNPEMAVVFFGVNVDDWHDSAKADDLAQVDLTRFDVTRNLQVAYDYAFQTGAYWIYGMEEDIEVAAFGRGVNPWSFEGSLSPYLYDDSKVRHVVDMALGRFKLEQGDDLSIRELALLASMTEAAVRNSLSKESIETQGKPAKVSAETALTWLQGRRGFIQTRKEETVVQNRILHAKVAFGHYPFNEALAALVRSEQIDLVEVARKAAVDASDIERILGGEEYDLDLEMLRRIGEALEIDAPHFVGVAVESAIRKKHPKSHPAAD